MFKKGFLTGVCITAGIFSIIILIIIGMIPQDEKDAKLETVKDIIEKSYIGEINEKSLQDGYLTGYVSGLQDPYSKYMPAVESEEFSNQIQGVSYGIGVEVLKEDDTCTIQEVYENSPAKESGLKKEDVIKEIDRQDVSNMSEEDIVSMLQGDIDTNVELLIKRKKKKPKKYTVTRGEYEIPTVYSAETKDKMGYVKIEEFSTTTEGQFQKALENIEKCKGLIIDLRDNPGGEVNACCNILDQLLPKGELVYIKEKNGKKTSFSSEDDQHYDKPIFVLVNENTASASEIFAGAIQDRKAGLIVGEKTFGKGVVQKIFDLGDGSSLKLTISYYYTPSGKNINGEGIIPDIIAYDEVIEAARKHFPEN